MVLYNMAMRGKSEALATTIRVCYRELCRKDFAPANKHSLYCSRKCYNTARMERYWWNRLKLGGTA